MDNIVQIEKVLQEKKYELPLILKSEMIQTLEKLYNEYQESLNPFLEEYHNNKISRICKGIIKCLKKYYEGFPQKAFEVFKSEVAPVIDENFIFYNKSITDLTYIDPLNLYRVREVEQKPTFKRKDIFHTPLDLREYVSASRYSIAGYPSLYLGTSVELCRIETGLNQKSQGIVSKFKLNRHDREMYIRVLDLAIKPSDITPRFDIKYDYKKDFIINYLNIYPLIAACSIKAKDKRMKFIPEYIVPQFLMQWLRSQQAERSISGIRYFTTRSKSPRIKGYNYVFPVSIRLETSIDNEYKFCPILSKCFNFTEPIFTATFENCNYLEEKLNTMECVKIEKIR